MITAKDTIIKGDYSAKNLLLGKGSICNIGKSVEYGVSERIANNSGKDITYLDKKVGGRLHKI